MKFRTKTAFAVAGIIVAFYIVNLSIMTYLIFKTNQDYLSSLLDERESSFREMISDEISELRSYLKLFVLQTEMSDDFERIKDAMENNNHLDAFVIANNSDITMLSKKNISENELTLLSKNTIPRKRETMECGFEKKERLYMVCTYSSKNGTVYTLIDDVDGKFFEDTRPLLALDIFYFSEKPPFNDNPLISLIPAEKIGGGIAGYFVIGYERITTSTAIQNIEVGVLVFTLSAFLFSTIGYVLFQKDVLRRVYTIRDFMIRVKEHRFKSSEKIEVGGNDEITELAESINSALNELEKSRNDLERTLENLRVLNRVLRHDLLNDLTAIRGFAEMGSDESELCKRVIERTDKAVRAIRMLRDVENIIKDSDLEKFRLSEVIKEVMETYDVEFEIDGDGDVIADSGIYSIFDNIVSNAIKHGGSRKIRFEIKGEGDFIRVVVKDYGTGIPKEFADNIFDEGFSLSDSTGIGLYIVKRFMEKYGGTVKAENSEKEGAVFHLIFRKFTDGSQSQETSSSE